MAENSVEHHPPSGLLLLCPLAWFTRPFTLGLLINTEATFSAVWAYNPYQSSVMDTPSRSVTANINGARAKTDDLGRRRGDSAGLLASPHSV